LAVFIANRKDPNIKIPCCVEILGDVERKGKSRAKKIVDEERIT
jgi:hypothetical protein